MNFDSRGGKLFKNIMVAEQQAKASSQAVDSTSSSSQEAGENEKNPAISSPHWEDANGQAITKALVGDEVYLCADVTDIAEAATNQMLGQLLSDKSMVRLVVVAHGDFDGNLYDVDDNVLGFDSHMPPIVDLVGCYASKKKTPGQDGHKNKGQGDIVVNTYNPGSSTETIDDDAEIWWNQTNEAIMKKIPESIRKGNVYSGGEPCVTPESFTKWIIDKL